MQKKDTRRSSSTYSRVNAERLWDEVVALRAEIAALREALPALWGQYDDEGRKLWVDPAEAMRAKCEAIVDAELVDSAEAAHTDDGDVYAAASAAYYALRTVRDRIAALKGKGEGK